MLPTSDKLLHAVITNSKRMMNDRGFTEIEEEIDDSSHSFIESHCYERVRRRDGRSVSVLLIIETKEVMSKNDMNEYNEDLRSLFANTSYMYCVYVHKRDSITVAQKHAIQTLVKLVLPEGSPSFQYFTHKSFYINITLHCLQPQFRCLTEQQLTSDSTVFRKENRRLLPKLSWNDPIRRYYNYAENAIIQITKDGHSTGQYVTYRIVVK